ncbi:MAG: nicotinate (nicotinamide) nucleotide adenylyltransferase [Pseudomonadota bacterium]
MAAALPRRIGIFGGAFDPPHIAHVALARAAIEQLRLDVLFVIPTGEAWHKSRTLTSAAHRLEMAHLAFAELDCVVVDPRETLRTGPSYTVDTLLELRTEFPLAQLYLVLGEDQAQALASWHRISEIPGIATICVAERADFTRAEGIFNALPAGISGLRQLEMPPMEVSATDIRMRLARGQSATPLVFDPVARYIAQHHLYRTA